VLRRSLALVLILLAACGGSGDSESDAATTSTTVRRTTSTTAGITASVDWTARTLAITGPAPVDIRFCDGDGPFLCVSRGDELLGSVELARFDGEVADFDTWATDFYDSMAADRIAGCDPAYRLEGADPEVAPVAGALGVRYGFVGRVRGVPVERVLGFAINDGGSLRILVANALADDGCLHRDSELPLDAMDELEPVLAAIAAGSRF
jgi:hypothetical protein